MLGQVKLGEISLVRSVQNSSVRSSYSVQVRSEQEVRLVDQDTLGQLGPGHVG